MSATCPYCGGPLDGEPALPVMRPRRLRVYRAVRDAGPDGISKEDLLVRMYGEDEWPTPGGPQVLRVTICDLNKQIDPLGQRIVSAWHGHYRLVAIKRKEDEEKVAEEADSEGSSGSQEA